MRRYRVKRFGWIGWLMVVALSGYAADFGDAPDARYVFPESPCAGYPSTLASNGVRHLDTTQLWLGRSVTDESDSKQGGDEDDFLLFPVVTSGSYRGDAWINVLQNVDPSDDGACSPPYGTWDSDKDWIVRNFKVPDLKPGEQRKVALPLPRSGCFRITLTTRPLANYTGRGTFQAGETEDWCITKKTKQVLERNFPPVAKKEKVKRPLPEHPKPPVSPAPKRQAGPQEKKTGKQEKSRKVEAKPHAFPVETGNIFGLYCRVYPRYSTKCETCVASKVNDCLMSACKSSKIGKRIQRVKQKLDQAIADANNINYMISEENNLWNCLRKGNTGKICEKLSSQAKFLDSVKGIRNRRKFHETLVEMWRNKAEKVEKYKKELKESEKSLNSFARKQENICRAQAERACAGFCVADQDRFATPYDLHRLAMCRKQSPRGCIRTDFSARPKWRPFASYWFQAQKKHGRIYGAVLKDALISFLSDTFHPRNIHSVSGGWEDKIIFIGKPKVERKLFSSPRVFRTSCQMLEVTPYLITTWKKAEYWRVYDFEFKHSLPLDLDRAVVMGMREILRNIPGVGSLIDSFMSPVINAYDRFEAGVLEGDEASHAFLDALRETAREELEAAIHAKIQGRLQAIREKAMKRFNEYVEKIQEQLESEFLDDKSREKLHAMLDAVQKAKDAVEKGMEVIDNIKKLRNLPDKVRREIARKKKEIEKNLGVCGQKVAKRLLPKVRREVEKRVADFLKGKGRFRILSHGISGGGITEGCMYHARVHAEILVQTCEAPSSCELEWEKRVKQDWCAQERGLTAIPGGASLPLITESAIRKAIAEGWLPEVIRVEGQGWAPLVPAAVAETSTIRKGAARGAVALPGGGTTTPGGGGGSAAYIPNRTYTGDGGCGLNTMTVISNTATQFVAQVPGNGTVTFTGTGQGCPACLYSASNLTVFGISGHQATIDLTPPANFAFSASNPAGGSCVEFFR